MPFYVTHIDYNLPDDDTIVSKRVAVWITQRDCCDVYRYEKIVHFLIGIKNYKPKIQRLIYIFKFGNVGLRNRIV